MPRSLLDHWTPEQAARMDREIFVAQHRLHTLPQFSDDALVELLDRHPRRDLGINTMGRDPADRNEWREGSAGELNGTQLLEAASRGRIWLNIRRVLDHHPQLSDLVHDLYADLEAATPGLRTFNRSANLLISSPGAQVYYHLDCPVNMLWHIRGRKRVWAYPLESGIVSDATIEGVLAGEKSEELDFRPEWDELAISTELEPGEMITWPQHTPHRVVNTEGLNVSLSTEHMTRAAVRRNNVLLANRHFRSLLPGAWTNTKQTGLRPALKEFALRMARRIPAIAPAPPQGYRYPVTFEVDLAEPDCVRLLGERELVETL
ncbi:MAG: hypothetical protein KF688_07120 [Pirellulales bacterium]|nr:hypothetical protein [Pirellulales bacterium]